MAINITFQPFKALSARTLNKITDFLTKHSQASGATNKELDPGFEHWAEAIRFDDSKSVQQAIDDIIGYTVSPDNFTASFILDPDDTDQGINVHDISPNLSNAIAGCEPGCRIGIVAGVFGLPQATTIISKAIEIQGEHKESTILYTSGVVTISGGILDIRDGIFTDITFRGWDERMLTISRGGKAVFENCNFECYSAPLIRIEPQTTTVFKDCSFKWLAGSDGSALIEYLNLPTDTSPSTYTTFSDCHFMSDQACTFVRYEGFDDLPLPNWSNFAYTMAHASQLRFLRCHMTNQKYGGTTGFSDSINRAHLEVVRHPNLSGRPLRMILEILHSHFVTYSTDMAFLSDASMTSMFLSTITGTGPGSSVAFNIRMGQELTSTPGNTYNPPDLADSADSAFYYGNIIPNSQFLAYIPYDESHRLFDNAANVENLTNIYLQNYTYLTPKRPELSGHMGSIYGERVDYGNY